MSDQDKLQYDSELMQIRLKLRNATRLTEINEAYSELDALNEKYNLTE